MICCSIEPGEQIFIKSHEFLSFAKTLRKNFGKTISKKLKGKCTQKFHEDADAIKTALRKQFKKQYNQLMYCQ